MKYCVYSSVMDKYYIGSSKQSIVNQLFKWRFEDRQLIAQCEGFVEVSYHTYSDEYTPIEMQLDAVNFLLNKLEKDFRCFVFIRNN